MASATDLVAHGDPGGFRPGDTLGPYQILRELAMGGMAALYIARNANASGFEKVIVVKRVLPNLARDEGFIRMFLNEARLAATLDHSNIVHVIDFGQDGREYYLAMEYVHGKGVHELLRAASRGPGVPIDCALTIARGVAQALHYAHERAGVDGRPMGLVHRDVSPSNILVSYSGDVKLADFGIATATELTRATRTGSIKGKLSYMAPEQVRGDNVDRRADIYSLGVVLYELTTGRRCFYAPGEFALINRVVEGKFDRPGKVREGFPAALEEIIVRALQGDREERFPTARDLQVALESFATAQGIQLSSVTLSTFMGRTFGHEDYPQTAQLPAPAAAAVPATQATLETTHARRRRARRALPALLVAGGVGAVVGIGIGVAMTLRPSVSPPNDAAPAPARGSGDERPDPAAADRGDGPATVERVAAAEDAAPEGAAEDPESERADEGADASADIIVIDPEEEPSARHPAGTRRTKRSSTRPRAAHREPPPGDVGYLPPSRRK